MAITFEETVQTVLILVREKERLMEENKALKEVIDKLMGPAANVREPDMKITRNFVGPKGDK